MKTGLGVVLVIGTLAAGCARHHDDAETNGSAIVGGLPATEYQEAATIDFTKDGQPFLCSGALIAPKVVLTAGHCVVGATNFLVRAGGFSSFTTSATVFDYTETAESVNFSQHDVGLIFLADPITLPRYAAIATSPVPSGTALMNVGRIQDGNITDNLFENSVAVEVPLFDEPFDYTSTDVIQPGDSGGPDFILGTHTIASVNSGASTAANIQSLARVDLLQDFIAQQIAAHGGGGAGPASGVIPNTTLGSVNRYVVVTEQLNCRAGAGTGQPVEQTLLAGTTLEATEALFRPRIETAPDGAPWLLVQTPSGGACYVSANFQFIAPSPEQPPPNDRMPGTNDLVVTPGLYGSLALAVHESTLTGSVREGNCELTIAGELSGANPMNVLVRTSQTAANATLEITSPSAVVFRAPGLSSSCLAVMPEAETGESLVFHAAISPVVFGFRTVQADRAFFHDGPSSPAKTSFVIKGQTVQQLGENEGGFVKVRFTGTSGPTTTGFLLESDLFPTLVDGTSL